MYRLTLNGRTILDGYQSLDHARKACRGLRVIQGYAALVVSPSRR